MRLFRNKNFFWEFTITAAVVVLAALIQVFNSPISALITVAAGVIVLLTIYYFGKKRFGDIEHLSEELDKILHGTEKFFNDLLSK